MSTKDDGGPAFPIPGLHADESFNGASLRDYFAAKVMQGLFADGKCMTYEMYAEQSYKMADIMIAERAK